MKSVWRGLPLLVYMTLMPSCTRPPSLTEKRTADQAAAGALAQTPTAENEIAYGLAEASLGHHDSAIQHYEAALVLKPASATANTYLCTENALLGRWAEARTRCERTLSLDPSRPSVLNTLRYVRQAMEIESSGAGRVDDSALINQGLLLYGKGEWAAAVKLWEQIKEKSRYRAMARSNMASAFIQMKEYPRAKSAIDEALLLEPRNELYRNNERWLERASATPN